jgi:hypothetical protein
MKITSRFFSKYAAFKATISTLFVVGLTTSCGVQTTASQEKSLNNFARGSADLTRNVCRGDNKVVKGIQQEWDHVDFSRVPAEKVPALKTALEGSLSAVPANLQEVFFGLGGRIVFADNLSKPATSSTDLTCDRAGAKAKFASEGTNTIESCWTTDTRTADVVILMNPTVESVHHSTVRIFGYILSQILTKISVNEESVITAQRDEQFDALITDIKDAFLADVKRPGSKYSLSINQSLVQTEDFKYFVFAESFDSYYCNSALRQTMARADEFPKTHNLLQSMDRELKAVQMAQNGSEANDSFSLHGNEAAFNLGILGGLFRGVGRVGGFLGRGLVRGVGAIGRGVAGLGRGIFRGGAALVRGGGRLLGGAAQGLAGLVGGGGGGGIGGGGIMNMIQSFMGG